MDGILVRLQRAVPRMESWIAELHARYAEQARAVSTLGYAGLARAWPSELLRESRVVAVDRTPFPPVSDYGIPEFEQMAKDSWAGITFGHMYFVDGAEADEATHFHELCHVVQWKVLGVRDFLLSYALGLLAHGYARSPLEAIAYELQREFESGRPLPWLTDRIAVHAKDAHAKAMAVLRSDRGRGQA